MTAVDLTAIFLAEFCPHNHCCFCGNYGVVESRGRVQTPAGFQCGARLDGEGDHVASQRLRRDGGYQHEALRDVTVQRKFWILQLV